MKEDITQQEQEVVELRKHRNNLAVEEKLKDKDE